MSGFIMEALKTVAGPIKSFVVDRIKLYLDFIKKYDANMTSLLDALRDLCSKKQDIDAMVMEGKDRLRVMTRETANWLKKVQELTEKEDFKMLMKDDRVADIAVKMMEQHVLKKLLKEDRQILDIVVNVVKKKYNKEGGNMEVVNAEEDADYKKVAKIAREVMRDTAEEFKKLIKEDNMAVAAVNLLLDDDMDKLRKDDDEMAKILKKAMETSDKDVQANHDEEELLIKKHDVEVKPVDGNVIKEKVGSWLKHLGSLMIFLEDDNFKKALPEGATLGLEVMEALSNREGFEKIEDNNKRHRYCGWCVVRFNGYRYCHDLSQAADIMVKEVISMIDKCPKERVTRLKRLDELEAIPNDFMAGLESREELLKKILKALKDDQVNVVGVFGMGGAGKTTLAKEVANNRAKDLFDKVIVVQVSETPNIRGIQDQIAESINLPLDDVHNVAQRALKLYNGLKSEKKRKILIILDNIWKKLNLEEVGIPRESTKEFCCKLLLTTRERQVCRVMAVKDADVFEVGMLNKKEAADLFENLTGKKVDSGEYKPVADRLLRKCGGLPLAIVATASALKGKELPIWCHFADESEKPISSQVSSEYRDTYSILETSYKLIESEEKRIFFFLTCLSPLDLPISVDDLMRYGIGLDLFQRVNKLSEAMEQASRWANELVSSSLLQNDDSDGQVKIHDIVRASAISFAETDEDHMILIDSIPRWMCKETLKKFTAISLMSGHDFSLLSGVNADMLQILILRGDLSSNSPDRKFFQGMTNLKVLVMSNMNFELGLPGSIEELKDLKTLHLHRCQLKDIKLIGKLVNLLVLSLRESTVEELPEEIGNLYNLRLLDMGGCKGKLSIPANVFSRLSHLEGLFMFNSFSDWETMNDGGTVNRASLSELSKVPHLNVLEISAPKLEQWPHDGQFIEQLGKSRIWVGNSDELEMKKVWSFRNVLELNGIDIFQALKNNCFKGLIKKADSLQIMNSATFKNLVPELDEEGFNDLRHLNVDSCTNVKFIATSDGQNELIAFANLESLRLYDLPLERVFDGKAPVGMLANLRYLSIQALWELTYLFSVSLDPLNLIEVSIKRCPSLKFIFIDEEAADEKEIDAIRLPCLKSLRVEGSESIISVVGQSENIDDGVQAGQAFFNKKIMFPSLESLNLSSIKKSTTLWSLKHHTSSFQNLKDIELFACRGLQSLGSPSVFAALVQLEKLTILSCQEMQAVISKETDKHEIRERAIVFPRLKVLKLDGLTKLECFYNGSYLLEFPDLRKLSLYDLPVMTKFVVSASPTTSFHAKIDFPCLEELEMNNVTDTVMGLWNWYPSTDKEESGTMMNNPVPKLKKLSLGKTEGLRLIPHIVSQNLSHLQLQEFKELRTLFSTSPANREVFWTYAQLPKLKELTVTSCHSLEIFFEDENDAAAIMLCGQLTELRLEDLWELKLMPLHLFKNIRSLYINHVRWQYLFSADLFIRGREQFQQLENLEIDDCRRMKAVIQDERKGNGKDRALVFPRLKSLLLRNFHIASNFCSRPSTALQFPSLERVEIEFCVTNFDSFCSGPFEAPKLKVVKLFNCQCIESFLSGNVNQELPSLESVVIRECVVRSFTSRPLTAPKLRDVFLYNCSSMNLFSPGNPNHDKITDFPSMESVVIKNCTSMQSFSTAPLRAPKISELKINGHDYSRRAIAELEDMLGNLSKYTKR